MVIKATEAIKVRRGLIITIGLKSEK